jgi:hypothetical protein
MDTKPMTTEQIKEILRSDSYSKLNFLGVFPRDHLPVITVYPVSFVLNTDPSYKEGEHWLGIYFDRKRKCYFFDSFGYEPTYFGLDFYMQKYASVIEFNKEQVQGFFSNTCGHYTVFFILLITRGFTFEEIISCFNLKKFDINDFRISFINK